MFKMKAVLCAVLAAAHCCSAKGKSYRGFNDEVNMPHARSDMSATSFAGDVFGDGKGSRIFLVGGCVADQHCPYNDWCFCPEVTASCDYYSPSESKWAQCADAPRQRSRHAAVSMGNKLYVLGGRDASDTIVQEVDVYDPITDSWSTLDYLWLNATSDGGAFVNPASDGNIYLVGGYDRSYNPVSTLQRFSPSSLDLQTLAPMSVPRGDIGVASVPPVVPSGETIHYVVGGFGFDICQPLGDAEMYDVATDSWTSLAPLDIGRGDVAISYLDNMLFVIAGETKAVGTCNSTTVQPGVSIPVDDVERYEPDTQGGVGAWYYEENIPSDRFRFVAASDVNQDVIFIFGGQGSLQKYSSDIQSESYYPVLNTTMYYVPQSVADARAKSELKAEEIAGIVIAAIVVFGFLLGAAIVFVVYREYRGYVPAPDGDADRSGDNAL